MGVLVKFPKKEYTALDRAEDLKEHFFKVMATLMVEHGIDPENHEEASGGIFYYIEQLIESHLGISNDEF